MRTQFSIDKLAALVNRDSNGANRAAHRPRGVNTGNQRSVWKASNTHRTALLMDILCQAANPPRGVGTGDQRSAGGRPAILTPADYM